MPCATEQALPHMPQLLTLFWTLASHPLPGCRSQSPKPLAQVSWHCPSMHVEVACWVPQEVPQAPQCCLLVLVSVSQPLARLPSQSSSGAMHEVSLHVPVSHDVVAPAASHF